MCDLPAQEEMEGPHDDVRDDQENRHGFEGRGEVNAHHIS